MKSARWTQKVQSECYQRSNGQSVDAGGVKRACQRGAGPAEQTASALDRCTCCSSSQSPEPAAPLSGRRRADASRSRRFSSPAEDNKRVSLSHRPD